MTSRSLRSATATWLVILLGVLHTGLPSHSHEAERPGTAPDRQVISTDHHSHGTLLVEQTERVQSTGVQLAITPQSLATTTFFTPDHGIAAQQPTLLRPSGRSPPPGAPRAPPQHI
jgi:hypothetical protein